MITVIACLLAAVSTTAFLVLWFWVVRRELRTKKNTVESAKMQLAAYHKKYIRTGKNPLHLPAKAVLERSEDIYLQSLELYNLALKKPQNRIPGFIMGFRQMKEGDDI